MKLLAKTSLNFITASTFLLMACSFGGYYFIRYSLNKSLNHELSHLKQSVNQSLEHGLKPSPAFAEVTNDTISQLSSYKAADRYSDTLIVSESGIAELYRKLEYHHPVNQQIIKVTLYRTTGPTDLLVMKFTFMLTICPLIFFISLYWVNRHSTKKSLSVLYDTIEKIKAFDVNKHNQIQLMHSDIDEFENLNEVFNSMEKKIKDDFIRLKEFTENTSHELQTPLAILTSRLEELLQAPNMTPDQVRLIAHLIETVNRISKINQALIFLAKIDNRMFDQTEWVNVNELILSTLQNLQFSWEDKQITITTQLDSTLTVQVNPTLIQTLIQNLIKNAIRHNVQQGFIHLAISGHTVTITNSGEPLEFEPDEAFSRYRNKGHHLSMGIGLSIVQRIAEVYHIDITYKNVDTQHIIQLVFQERL